MHLFQFPLRFFFHALLLFLLIGFVQPASAVTNGKIVFSSNKHNWHGEIYIMNADGTGQVRLTNNTVEDTTPCISRDGKKIVFSSDRDGHSQIYTMNPDGTGVKRITNSTADEYQPTFTPDGKTIVYHGLYDWHNAPEKREEGQLFKINVDGTNLVRLSKDLVDVYNDDYSASVSPDGSKIVFTGDRYYKSGTEDFIDTDIFIMNIDGSNQTRLTLPFPQFPATWPPLDLYPSFSLDGSKIIFTSERSFFLQVFAMNLDGSGLVSLMSQLPSDPDPLFCRWPSYSPDGKKIVFQAYRSSQDNNITEIYSMDANGSNIVKLTSDGFKNERPTWAPDLNPPSAPTLSISLNSSTPRTKDTLQITAVGKSSQSDALTYSYVWKKTVNATTTNATTTILKTTSNTSTTNDSLNLSTVGNGDKGDIITVEVVAKTSNGLTSTRSLPLWAGIFQCLTMRSIQDNF